MFDSINSEVTTLNLLAIDYAKDYHLHSPYSPIYGCSVQAVWSDATPASVVVPSADVNPDPDNSFTSVDHGFPTGLIVNFTTADAPSGLTNGLDYYVIRLDVDHFQVAATRQDAVDGIPVTFTNQGTGDQTFTTTPLTSAIVKLQMSNDGINFTDITGKNEVATGSGSVLWDLGHVTFRVLRVVEVPNYGAMNLILNFNGTNLL